MDELEIGVSKVFTKIRKANTRIIVNEGSSRSTKTFSYIQYLLACGFLDPTEKTTICRDKLTWLKASVIPDFIDVLTMMGIFREEHYHRTDQIYTLDGNGAEFHFIGLDEEQKLHGRKQDRFWLNEAIEVSKKKYMQLAIRTKKQILMDYNPSTDSHWIYDSVIPRNDCTFIKSTYKDNPFLDSAIVAEIERLEPTPENIAQGTADPVAWKIYGLGERASQTGLIFGWIQLCDKMPTDYKKEFYGLDFGFTNHPTALVHIRLSGGALYFRQLLYKRGLTNIKNPNKPSQPSIEHELEKLRIPKTARIWADGAEPKTIKDLQNCGYNVMAAVKGADSIIIGIDVIKRYPAFITNASIDMIKERNNYKWAVDKDDKATNTPIDSFNHAWDAARYGCRMELGEEQLTPKVSRI